MGGATYGKIQTKRISIDQTNGVKGFVDVWKDPKGGLSLVEVRLTGLLKKEGLRDTHKPWTEGYFNKNKNRYFSHRAHLVADSFGVMDTTNKYLAVLTSSQYNLQDMGGIERDVRTKLQTSSDKTFSATVRVSMEPIVSVAAFKDIMTTKSCVKNEKGLGSYVKRFAQRIEDRLYRVEHKSSLLRRVASMQATYIIDGHEHSYNRGRDIRLEMPDRFYTDTASEGGDQNSLGNIKSVTGEDKSPKPNEAFKRAQVQKKAKEFAQELGVSVSFVNKMRTGQANMRETVARKLAKDYTIAIEEFGFK